jgi:hypothetical protein
MTKPWWGSKRIVIMDSAFCQLKALIELEKRGIYATSVIKKRKYWPKHIDGAQMDTQVDQTPVGTSRCLRGKMDGQPFALVTLKDTKHNLKLATTCGSMERVPEIKRRRDPITNQRLEFSYPDVIATYYKARHAVDDNNNLRQGNLGFEEGFSVNSWFLRQFIALTAISEVNALNYYNYVKKLDNKDTFAPLSLVQFRRNLAEALINNHYLPRDEPEEHIPRKLRSSKLPGHELVKAPTNTGKWRGHGWTEVKTRHLKRTCSGKGCSSEIRTYCTCNPLQFWCSACFYTQHMESLASTTN